MNRDAEIFADAAGLPAGARAAFLDQACGGDAGLRARVEALLRGHDEANSFLQQPLARTLDAPPGEERPGDVIGRYKLLERIGEGGCGIVWAAEQSEPVRRRVALKVIKLGMDTKEVIARFEAERQALALMDHPNIAKVLDAGATATGRPFFVMELVHGVPITRFCDEAQLPLMARLKLFIDVCHAVQHAHQKGVIHRDLKPSNILVTVNDGAAVPKVIDFGIAKATQGRLADQTIYTAFDQFIGTPAYMSPEQAVMTSLDIDTRSDIYSLGVLLYELLTGRTPFDTEALLQSGLDAMRRHLREVDPPKPSTRLSTMQGDALTSTAHHRHTEPPKLISLIRGDLDWIVMKALEKDRTRRYETANGLADDLLRHLRHEPVSACPPSAAYRARKFIRRHRVGVAASAAIGAALVLGAVLATWQAVRATRAEYRAATERDAANTARALAEQRRTEVETINKLLLSDTLTSNHPEFAQGREVTVREVLDSAALRIAGAFANNPLLEAAIREAIGETYSKLSVFDKAEAHLQAAYETRRRLLGVEHPDTLASRRALGALRVLQLRPREAEVLLREVLAVHQRTLGPEHEETLRTLDALFDAIAAQAESAGLPKPKRQPLLDAIEELARSAYAAATKRLGPEHPLALTHLQHHAWALYLACVWDLREGGAKPEKVAEFAALAEQLLTIRRRVLGPEHPDTILAIDMRARAFGVQGNKAQKVQLLRECLALTERVMGPDHWLTGCSYYLVGLNLRATAERAEAGPLLLRAARILLKAYGWDSGSSAQFLSLLGKLAIEDGHGETVAKFAEELLPEARRQSPTANAVLRSLAAVLGEAYLVQGRAGEAEPLLRETLALYETAGLGTTRGFITESLLGESLLAQRRFAEAEPRLLAGYQGMKSRLDSMNPMLHPQLWNAAERLVRLYTDWGQMAKADEWKKALADLGPRPGPVPLRSQPTKP